MAGARNSAMFTSGTTDLLQQAFQQVIDDEHDEHDDESNEFVTLLGSGDSPAGKTIQLTSAQAAALGLSFEIDSPDVPQTSIKSGNNTSNLPKFDNDFFTGNWVTQTVPQIAKPSQTLLKNVRILPNTSKVENASLLPKTTLINAMPSLIRAIPVSTLKLGVNSSPQVSQAFQSLNKNRFVTSSLSSSVKIPGARAIQIAPRASAPSKTSSVPMVFRAQDSKATTTTHYSIPLKNHGSSTPVSLLKSALKVTNGHAKNSTSTWQSAQNISTLTKTSPSSSLQNGTMKAKIVSGANLPTGMAKKEPLAAQRVRKIVNPTKPLGSTENPIQIVQQGQTFHSTQQLSPAQLKQIVQVLQQRQQSNPNSNEKVVYRVVFPEEQDSQPQAPGTLSQAAKRGRPKKSLTRHPMIPAKSTIPNEEHEDTKQDERKKVVARTRSGRLSRPPKHMVRDYKHLHHLDFTQPDLDDSDGGYSDYNTNGDNLEDDEYPKDLLTGLEVPKRKISDHFRCPTCNKIYLGRSRMSRHFEAHPDHGSPAQLPPPTPEPGLKQLGTDPLKRKGKKRGPWAYVTPEAKSERRQVKLKEAISVCEDAEIEKIAAKPVLNALSMYKLLILRSENSAQNFLKELKTFLDDVRNNVGPLLVSASEQEKEGEEVLEVNDEYVREVLGGVDFGRYKLVGNIFEREQNEAIEEPPQKVQKVVDNVEERPECPEVLTALTLVPRNLNSENKSNPISKLLISNPEIQNQISDSSGFQKVDIGTKFEAKEQPFSQVVNPDVFVKLEAMEQGFVKLEGFEKLQDKETSIFGNADNLASYDHITHLDILHMGGVMDEKMTEHLNLEQTNIDEIVHERLKNIMPDNILEDNIMSNQPAILAGTDLDFETLSEEFGENVKS